MKYYNWYNASNNYRPSDVDNKCVLIDPSLDYQWSDENCNAQAYFVCMRGMYSYIVRL